MADDCLKLDSNQTIYRIQSNAGIYPHKDNIKDLNLSFIDRLIAWLKYHFLQFTFLQRFIYPNIVVDYKKIGIVEDETKLDKIFILEKGKNEILKTDIDTAINKYLASTFSTFPLPPKGFPTVFVQSYCFKNGLSIDFIIKKYKEILRSAFLGKEIFILRGENYLDFYKLFLKHEKIQD